MATALPTLLYKYASADAGLAMLKSQSLRWSSPNLWPAAYEINGNTGLSFSQKEFLDGTVKLATSLIFNPSAPRGDSALISAINRWREAGRFHKPEEAQAVLRDLLSKMVAQRQGILDEAITSWQTFVQNARVACLSADKDSLTAWDKYADQHRGVVLAIDPQHDEKLSQAKPIRYDSQRVHLTTIKEQISGLLNNTKSSVTERFEVNLLS